MIAYLREKLHLDEPLPVRYVYWVGGVLKATWASRCASRSRCAS